MDGVAAVASSIEAVNRVFQAANSETLKAVEKMMKVSVEMALGKEAGKGELLDMVA